MAASQYTVAFLITYIVPSGEYIRVSVPSSGRELIDPTSYHTIDKIRLTPLDFRYPAFFFYPKFADTTTTPVGKVVTGKSQSKKDLTKIMVAHNIPYVAQTTFIGT